jgi:hypothetical protein
MKPIDFPTACDDLPGWEMISEGLADAAAGRLTPFACLVWIALPRLSRAGLIRPEILAHPIDEPNLALYRLLRAAGGNAYGRYNALVRRLVSFQRSLDRWAGPPRS